MSMQDFGTWLYGTHLSTAIRDLDWLIPAVQSVHILAIAILIGSALVSDLRLAGVLANDETPATVVRRYLPWMWCALVVLLMTGTVMVLAEPGRTLTNLTFWIKMALVLTAFVMTLLFRRPILHPEFRLDHATWNAAAKPLAWVSLVMWVAIIFCGRWIAYT